MGTTLLSKIPYFWLPYIQIIRDGNIRHGTKPGMKKYKFGQSFLKILNKYSSLYFAHLSCTYQKGIDIRKGQRKRKWRTCKQNGAVVHHWLSSLDEFSFDFLQQTVVVEELYRGLLSNQPVLQYHDQTRIPKKSDKLIKIDQTQ